LEANIEDTWDFDVDWGPGARGNPVFVLQQKGAEVTGTYSGVSGRAAVSGTLKGPASKLKLNTRDGAMSVTEEVDESGREMRGGILFVGHTGAFIAKRRRLHGVVRKCRNSNSNRVRPRLQEMTWRPDSRRRNYVI
jgi:hypothetical protein